jgi:hypothetical protein
MELEASDDEDEMLNEDDMMSLEKSRLVPSDEVEENKIHDEAVKKSQKRKPSWGPSLRIPRPKRIPNDGRTVMQRAQELKKGKNLDKGTKYSSSFAFASNKALIVGIDLGIENLSINDTIDGLNKKN